MMANCPECGKRHVVTWPELSPFRRGEHYYCSHKCWQISIQRDMKSIKDVARARRFRRINMNKVIITEDMRRHAIEMALNGESPLSYLKECGVKNPSSSWMYIKQQLRKKDKVLYDKLPDQLPKAVKVETPETPAVTLADAMAGMKDAAEEFFSQCKDMGLKVEPEKEPEDVKVDDFDARAVTTAIRVKGLGEFYHDMKYNCIDWRAADGDEVSMSPAGWKQLIDDLPMILTRLGVEV